MVRVDVVEPRPTPKRSAAHTLHAAIVSHGPPPVRRRSELLR
jgi:hypothetical protein